MSTKCLFQAKWWTLHIFLTDMDFNLGYDHLRQGTVQGVITHLSSDINEGIPGYMALLTEDLQIQERTLTITVIELVLKC